MENMRDVDFKRQDKDVYILLEEEPIRIGMIDHEAEDKLDDEVQLRDSNNARS